MGLVNTSEMKRLCHTVYLTDEDIDLIKETFEISVRSIKNKRKKEKIHALFMYLATTKMLSPKFMTEVEKGLSNEHN